MTSPSAALRRGAAVLSAAGIEAPRLEARLLLAHALDIAPAALVLGHAGPVETGKYLGLLGRRAAREPLALILGRREFWSLDFAVTTATLVPRPESETLIEAACTVLSGGKAPRTILDLGTGTGCLLLAALTEFPSAFGIGVDRVPAAAALAAGNAARLGLADRCAFVCGDWATSLHGRFDLLLCNPPYIRSGDIPALMPEVSAHEPRTALDGGPDGLAAYRRLISSLPELLSPGAIAILEIGEGQDAAVQTLAIAAGFTTSVRADLAGTPRALILRSALPQKNRLAEPQGESSFQPVAGTRRKVAVPGAPAGSTRAEDMRVVRTAPASTNVDG